MLKNPFPHLLCLLISLSLKYIQPLRAQMKTVGTILRMVCCNILNSCQVNVDVMWFSTRVQQGSSSSSS